MNDPSNTSPTVKQLAQTLEWLADRGVIRGLHPKSVRDAAKLLSEQDAQIKALNFTLSANRHSVYAEELEGSMPYTKEHRLHFVLKDAVAYHVRHETTIGMEYPAEERARQAVSMCLDQARDELVEKAMVAIMEATPPIQKEPD